MSYVVLPKGNHENKKASASPVRQLATKPRPNKLTLQLDPKSVECLRRMVYKDKFMRCLRILLSEGSQKSIDTTWFSNKGHGSYLIPMGHLGNTRDNETSS